MKNQSGLPPALVVAGAREKNLRGLSVEIPHGRFTVVTGPSGSGKSSLAIDTIYAEGQRRYVETFSAYARQFLERLRRPRVDSIEGCLPAVLVSSAISVRSARSTVGTMTEICDLLQILFARASEILCRSCSRPVRAHTSESAAADLLASGAAAAVVACRYAADTDGEDARSIARRARADGFARFVRGGAAVPLEHLASDDVADGAIEIALDRIALAAGKRARLADSLEQALALGGGLASAVLFPSGERRSYATRLRCADCGIDYRQPTPHRFSFNHFLGACAECQGFGRTIGIDPARVVPDAALSLADGAVKPWTTPSFADCRRDALRFAEKAGIDTRLPWSELEERDRKRIWDGEGKKWYGVRGFFEWLESKTYRMHIRILLSKYRGYFTCGECGGTRFNPEARLHRLGGLAMPQVLALTVDDAAAFVERLGDAVERRSLGPVRDEALSRLSYLREVGLSYLTLDRASRTLSGGELERVHLTSALGSRLVSTLYVLDEPSVGLHARDAGRLVGILRRLTERGNTVLAVEHDPAVVLAADRVVELGPGSGRDGGALVFEGPPAEMLTSEASPTGRHLRGISPPLRARNPGPRRGAIRIEGATEHNLEDVTVEFPLGRLVAVTGVSGSGKSTLVEDVLYRSVERALGRPTEEPPGACRAVIGLEAIREASLVDQSPIGRTPRGNPATYLDAWGPIRKIFAAAPDARSRRLTLSAFSFNVKGWRCETCEGTGMEKVPMQFLSDIFVPCGVCDGARFRDRVLEVRLRGKSIVDVLEMTAEEALEFFSEAREVVRRLSPLRAVGLEYVRLGQPVNTLSAGEGQRLKLARALDARDAGRTLFVLDEPTTGLHASDVARLLEALRALVDRGASVVVVEHHLDVVAAADWVIDLGPEGGRGGGRVVAAGPPGAIAAHPGSHTGRFLRDRAAAPAAAAPAAPAGPGESNDAIEVRGARHHNLRGIDVRIPRGRVVALTGLSGSGKSTLAFDIVFAEGQRRYVESLSAYARQFVAELPRPDVDAVIGLPPTVAIEQNVSRGGSRSTVSTATEIHHHLRLLFARVAEARCPTCDEAVAARSADEIVREIAARHRARPVLVLAPLVRARKGVHRELVQRLARRGFERARVDGEIVDAASFRGADKNRLHDVEAVVGSARASDAKALADLVRRALDAGGGTLLARSASGPSARDELLGTSRSCPRCGLAVPELDPRHFSFASPLGACDACGGSGKRLFVDPERVLAFDEPFEKGATAALRAAGYRRREIRRAIREAESSIGISRRRALRDVSPAARRKALRGTGGFEGILDRLERALTGPNADAVRERLAPLSRVDACDACGGSRLGPIGRAARIDGTTLPELSRLPAARAIERLREIAKRLEGRDAVVARDLVAESVRRLDFLVEAGLNYLALDRAADTLSGGESQRLRLAAQAGSRLSGIAIVLDEPTIGLHASDGERLRRVLARLARDGNTVLVVEHDEEMIRCADHVIDLGPGGGVEGGTVVAAGTPEEIAASASSVTGRCLSGGGAAIEPSRAGPPKEWITLEGARTRNLRDATARFPVSRLTVVSGVSGSGKSSLVLDTLYPAALRALGLKGDEPGPHRRLLGPVGGRPGAGRIERAVLVDQSPIGKTPRSTPASYVGILDEIRGILAMTPEARARGYSASRFSFNVPGGRCEACAGQGQNRVEMAFLPHAFVPCDECGGARYGRETLDVRYRGRSIAAILDLSVREARGVFEAFPRIRSTLEVLDEVGLGYLRLGQSSPSLSGGEAQRVKLAAELGGADSEAARRRALFLLDEPTTGLHMADVARLVLLLRRLAARGHTVVVVEHHLDVVAAADHVVDLGPGAGEEGGRIVFQGRPEELARRAGRSATGRHLAARLRPARAAARARR